LAYEIELAENNTTICIDRKSLSRADIEAINTYQYIRSVEGLLLKLPLLQTLEEHPWSFHNHPGHFRET
jgi:hypothetical protein